MEALSSGGQASTVLPLQHRAVRWEGQCWYQQCCATAKGHDWNSRTFAGAVFNKLDLKVIKMFIERAALASDSDSELLLIRVPSSLLSR